MNALAASTLIPVRMAMTPTPIVIWASATSVTAAGSRCRGISRDDTAGSLCDRPLGGPTHTAEELRRSALTVYPAIQEMIVTYRG